MLQIIVDAVDLANTEVNEESLAACKGAVDYARDVGVLDRKTSQFQALTAEANFTCREKVVVLSGQTWKIPSPGPGPSSAYKIVDKSFQIQPELESNFEFCEPDEATSGGFTKEILTGATPPSEP